MIFMNQEGCIMSNLFYMLYGLVRSLLFFWLNYWTWYQVEKFHLQQPNRYFFGILFSYRASLCQSIFQSDVSFIILIQFKQPKRIDFCYFHKPHMCVKILGMDNQCGLLVWEVFPYYDPDLNPVLKFIWTMDIWSSFKSKWDVTILLLISKISFGDWKGKDQLTFLIVLHQ